MLDDWKECRLGDIITLQRGFDLPIQNRLNGKVPIVSSSGICGYHNEAKATGEGVITGRYGTLGQIFYFKEDYWPLNTTLWVKDFKGNSPKFVYYALKTLDFLSCSDKSSVPGLNRNDLHLIQTHCPPLLEQRAIAEVLGVLDDKIDLNCRMNETLEATAQALFKSWFVDFDPVRAKAEGRPPEGLTPDLAALFPSSFTPSSLGDIPEDWRVEPLDQVADFLNGLALQKFPAQGSESLPAIKIAELRNGITSKSDRVSVDLPSQYVIHNGDILFSWSGSLTQVIWTQGKGALNQHLFKVSSSKYPKWLHYWWVEYYLPWFQQIAASKATTMGHIQRQHLTQALTVIPNQPCLQAIGQIMHPLFERLISNGLQTQTLAQTRDALLPKLMSGQLRVQDAQPLVEGLA